jgi:hypothetical protein
MKFFLGAGTELIKRRERKKKTVDERNANGYKIDVANKKKYQKCKCNDPTALLFNFR